MEKTGIINFSQYSKGSDVKKNDFDKNDFNDFFLNKKDDKILENAYLHNSNLKNLEDVSGSTSTTGDTNVVEEEDVEEEVINDTEEVEETEDTSSEQEEEMEEEEEEMEEEVIKAPINSEDDNYYSIYKDKSEDFSCDISLEGASLDDTEARLIIECDDWTLMFKGTISNKGKCTIPIKKLSILNEGCTGKIKLEIIADGSIFVPWEDNFKVKISKKVSVKVQESKSNFKKPVVKKPFVSDIKIRSKK
jgi:hypothetical protein